MIEFSSHDHETCITDAMASVERHCHANGLKLTPVRRRVLEILLERHQAMGAYDILDVLRAEGLGSQPPVAYRALDFLVRHGFAHKIERLNAFVACSHTGEDHVPAFLICRACDKVAEAQSAPVRGAIDAAAQMAQFRIERTVVEIEGVCPNCEDSAV